MTDEPEPNAGEPMNVSGVVTGDREQIAVVVEPRGCYVEVSLATSGGTVDLRLSPEEALKLAREIANSATVLSAATETINGP